MSDKSFEGWAILELMGHRRLGGYVTEAEIAGAPMLRIDVPGIEGGTFDMSRAGADVAATQFYSASAVYCITPVTEDVARIVAARAQPEPVQRWELPAPREPVPAGTAVEDDIPDDDPWPDDQDEDLGR